MTRASPARRSRLIVNPPPYRPPKMMGCEGGRDMAKGYLWMSRRKLSRPSPRLYSVISVRCVYLATMRWQPRTSDRPKPLGQIAAAARAPHAGSRPELCLEALLGGALPTGRAESPLDVVDDNLLEISGHRRSPQCHRLFAVDE